MSADLREAFHTAAVAFVGWHRVNEQQRWIGWRNSETGQREYLPEPTVDFFGRLRPISELCGHAAALDGELPPHIRKLFEVIDDGTGELLPETYPQAVEALEAAIACEHDFQTDAPLDRPCILDQVRTTSFFEGATATLARHAADSDWGGP